MLKRLKRIPLITLCLVMVLTSMFSLTITTSANSANILRPHLSWNQADSATTMTITWETTANVGSSVNYGTSSTNLNLNVGGQSFYSSEYGRYIHKSTITGLTPNTKYYYQCGAGADWSAVNSFTTAPSKGSTTAFRVGIFADSQNNSGTANANWAVTTNLVNKMVPYNPDFIIHAGDLTTGSSWAPNISNFLDVMSPLVKNVPFMPVGGNHDAYYTTDSIHTRGDLVDGWFDAFALPNNEIYYSYDYGNMHVTNIYCGEAHEDGDVWFAPGTAQYNWVVSDLSSPAAQSAEWKVVNIHVPAYGGGAWTNTGVRADLVPLFEQYGVDLVVAGHVHDYDRCKSIKGGAVVENGPNYTDKGTVHVIAASAGGNLGSGSGDATYTAYSSANYTFSIVDVNNKTLTWNTYKDDGTKIDTFTITHPSSAQTLFFSGLESGQPAPTWFDTVDTAGGNSANVSGYISGVGPECGPRGTSEHVRTGSYSLMAAGTDNSTSSSYCYFKVFDVNIPVTSTTQLSYYIYPLQANGRYVSIDMIFTDGTQLRNLGCTDQNGNSLHPAAGHGGNIALNAWSQIYSTIGTKAAGKTIDRILVGYDQAASTGQFRTYIDDIHILNP